MTRAALERVGVGVAELQFNMLAMRFDSFAADTKRLCDPANAVTGAKLALQLHAQACPGGDREALEVAERQLSRMTADLQRFFDLGRMGMRRISFRFL